MNDVIAVDHLTKQFRVHKRDPGFRNALRSLFRRRYETISAVDDLSFRISPGERVGFLGPNGAGKTTTLKVLSGLLHPTSGSVTVAGHLPQKRNPDFLRKITLVMGQKQQLLWDLPPVDTFELNRAVYDVPREQFKETLAELETLLEIGAVMRKPTRQLSLGERMKCELAAALLHRPQVLFLDEPTIGLDVSMQLTVREFVRRYNERFASTILLTSHYMDDVVALCPRVVVIDKGRLRFDGPLADLVRKHRPEKRIMLQFERPVDRADLEAIGQVIELEGRKGILQVRQTDLKEAMSRLFSALPVGDLTVEDPPIEEVMRELFARGDENADKANSDNSSSDNNEAPAA